MWPCGGVFGAWRVYDFLLLAFTFAHGMNGLRQVYSIFSYQDEPHGDFFDTFFLLGDDYTDRGSRYHRRCENPNQIKPA